MPRLVPDVSPLRESREFRLLWSGQIVSQTGSALRIVAIPYQVYLLTGSPLAVGLVGLFSALPTIALSLFGGVIADRADRRRLLLIVQTLLTLNSAALALTTASGLVSVPLLYLFTFIGGGLGALDSPARAALVPTLVERRRITAAVALNQTQFQTAAIAGPALAGVVIAAFGLATTYWIDVATYFAAIATIALMTKTARPPVEHPSVLRSLAEGIAYLGAKRILLATMSLDFLATLFGNWRALLPFYAEGIFRVGALGYGLLSAAPGVGALAVAVTSGWTASTRRQGAAILVSVAIFGIAIAAFGALPSGGFVAGLLLLAVAQGADTVSSIFRNSIVQLETPDALRGRLNAINTMFVLGGPTLGQVEGGVVGQIWGPVIAVVSGGLLCVASVGAIAGLAPLVARYTPELAHEEAAPSG